MDNAYGTSPISPELLKEQQQQNGITNTVLDAMKEPVRKFTPEFLANAAYRETEDVPIFTPKEKFEVMLARLNRYPTLLGDDDNQAAIIKACRVRAGL